MRNMYYVDMHCHPAPKPFSRSLRKEKNLRKNKKEWDCRNVNTSLWYNDPPKGIDKFLNRRIGLTRFTQSDFRTLTKGDVRIISACLSPIERDLVIPRCPPKILDYSLGKIIGCILLKIFGTLIIRIIGLFALKYIRDLKKRNRDYFKELQKEYIFYLCEERKQHNGIFPTQFELTRSFVDIDPNFKNLEKDIIYVFFSIEGCHVFNNGGLKNSLKDPELIKKNIQKVKKWRYRPLYISLAHHMNNDLCGHAKSLTPLLERVVNQKKGMGEGFSKDGLGEMVLHELLDKKTGRINIDIKHMSKESRRQYYKTLHDKYDGDPIPVFASHGAVNGNETGEMWDEKYFKNVPEMRFTGADQEMSVGEYKDVYQNENELEFNEEDINFFDDEIIIIQKTGGFLGIQIDERRLCSRKQKKLNRRIRKRGTQLYHQAGLVWKQIRYVAKVLDRKKKFGWGTAAIGSDYDGLVDPPNGFWTSEDFGILEENMIHHAAEYFKYHSHELTQKRNRQPALPQANPQDQPKANAQEVIDLFMRGNALRFLKDFYQENATKMI